MEKEQLNCGVKNLYKINSLINAAPAAVGTRKYKYNLSHRKKRESRRRREAYLNAKERYSKRETFEIFQDEGGHYYMSKGEKIYIPASLV